MHIRPLLIIGGCGHYPTIHLRLGYNNCVIKDAIKDTDTTNNLISERRPPRHPIVLLNVAG